MRTIWALALLGLVLLIPLASAGDVASSEASGELGVGTENEDDQGEDLQTLTSESLTAESDSNAFAALLVVLFAIVLVTLVWALRSLSK